MEFAIVPTWQDANDSVLPAQQRRENGETSETTHCLFASGAGTVSENNLADMVVANLIRSLCFVCVVSGSGADSSDKCTRNTGLADESVEHMANKEGKLHIAVTWGLVAAISVNVQIDR